jgi:NAD+ synthase
VAAVGPDQLFGLLMPYRTSSADSKTDAVKMAGQLGIDHRTIDISPMIDAYFDRIDDSIRIRAGNKMARERMSILFDVAHKMGRLVLGAGNRTETCLGYTTWYGDAACSVNPIGELYKTDVRHLARIMSIPESIITKTPSADLWQGQTDEGEIGITYEEVDLILQKIVDEGQYSLAVLEQEGLNPVQVSRVVSQMNRNAFKRALPAVAPLGRTAIPDDIQLDT